MPRTKNWMLLDATHRVLYEDPRLDTPAIHTRLLELGFRPKRSSIPEYVKELRAMGVLDAGSNRPRFAPLYAAYLLTDLPPARLVDLSVSLEQHSTRVRALRHRARPQAADQTGQLELFLRPEARVDILMGWPPQMVVARGTEELLRELEADCSALGVFARLFMVESARWTPASSTGLFAA